jgi:uncharacterized protein
MTHELIDSRTEMDEILRQETIGWLGLCGDGGPYVVPLNYAYVDGRILFHCAMEGLKLDCIRANPEVCFSVGRQSGEVRRHAGGGVCHVDSDSVICFGRARILEDIAERAEALNAFQRAFRPDAAPIPEQDVQRCGAVEIAIREMTGRRERARQCTHWRHVF